MDAEFSNEPLLALEVLLADLKQDNHHNPILLQEASSELREGVEKNVVIRTIVLNKK